MRRELPDEATLKLISRLLMRSVPGRAHAKPTGVGARRQTQPITTRTAAALRCRRKFLRFFPSGFEDETYIAWERGYKAEANDRWQELLSANEHRRLLM